MSAERVRREQIGGDDGRLRSCMKVAIERIDASERTLQALLACRLVDSGGGVEVTDDCRLDHEPLALEQVGVPTPRSSSSESCERSEDGLWRSRPDERNRPAETSPLHFNMARFAMGLV